MKQGSEPHETRISGLGFRFRVQGKFVDRVSSSWKILTMNPDLECRFTVQGSGFRVQGSGFRVQDLGGEAGLGAARDLVQVGSQGQMLALTVLHAGLDCLSCASG